MLKAAFQYFLNNLRRIYVVAAPFVVSRGTSTLFSKVVVPAYILPNSAGEFPFRQSLFSTVASGEFWWLPFLTGEADAHCCFDLRFSHN